MLEEGSYCDGGGGTRRRVLWMEMKKAVKK